MASRRELLRCLLVVAVGAMAYANTVDNGFVWDDHQLIEQNRFLRSWRFVPRLFVTDLSEGYEGGTTTMYRPVWMLSQLVDFQLWGPEPAAFHLVNLLWHLGTALALYALLRQLAIRPGLAMAGVLVFVVHPVHTETVSFTVGRCAVMSACFCLLAVLLALRARCRPLRSGWSIAARAGGSAVAFALALLAKESAVVLPLVVAGGCWLLRTGPAACRSSRAGDPAAPAPDATAAPTTSWVVALGTGYLIVLALYFGLRWSVLSQPTYPSSVLWADRLPLALRALAGYVALAWWPHNLHIDRSLPGAESAAGWVVLAGGALVLLLAGAAAWFYRRDPRVTFGLVMVGSAGVLTSNLIPIQPAFAERWMYWPLAGLILALAAALDYCLPRTRASRWAVVAATGVVVAALVTATVRQNRVWKDDRILFETVLARGADSARTRTSLGRLELAEGNLTAARRLFRDALARRPNNAAAMNGLGAVAAREGRRTKAVAWFRRVLRTHPADVTAADWLAHLLQEDDNAMGAEQVLRDTARASTRGLDAWLNLARFYYRQQRWQDAAAVLERVLARDPQHATAHNLLGTARVRLGQPAEAARHFHLALRYDRWLFEAHANLAHLAEAQGEMGAAVRHFGAALHRAPHNADLYYALGSLLERHHQPDAARRAFRRALELEPDFVEASAALERLPPATAPRP